ncbi:MAG: CBS domain-containing protein [Granulosicoccus sp.]
MQISSVLQLKGGAVKSVSKAVPLRDAIKILAVQRIGAVIVSEDGEKIDGILSERDVVRAVADAALDVNSMIVSDLMTAKVRSCSPDASIAEVMALMNQYRIRHVPVVADGALCGVVSMRDLVDSQLQEAEAEREQMAHYIAGDLTG